MKGLWFLALALACVASGAQGDTLTLKPSGDSRLVYVYGNTKYGNEQYLSSYDIGPNMQRSVLQFDLSSIPGNMTITSATLRLWVSSSYSSDTSGMPTEIYRVTQPWVEANVSWVARDIGMNWTSAGGDFAPNIYATNSTPGNIPNQDLIWDVTSLAQEWHVGTSANHGMLLRGYEGNGRLFLSKEYSDPAKHPTLEIEYSQVPEPSSLLALSLSLPALMLCRRLR